MYGRGVWRGEGGCGWRQRGRLGWRANLGVGGLDGGRDVDDISAVLDAHEEVALGVVSLLVEQVQLELASIRHVGVADGRDRAAHERQALALAQDEHAHSVQTPHLVAVKALNLHVVVVCLGGEPDAVEDEGDDGEHLGGEDDGAVPELAAEAVEGVDNAGDDVGEAGEEVDEEDEQADEVDAGQPYPCREALHLLRHLVLRDRPARPRPG